MRHLFIALISIQILSQAALATSSDAKVDEIVVRGMSESSLGIKRDEPARVEVIRAKTIEKKQAQTFSQAINNERGIDSQTACAFCGAKRITINGLRGEHTTILVDGLQLHSTISGFYGVDAIPLGSIDSIEVSRGAGASQTAPESIGGTLNIVTKDILATGAEARVSVSDDQQRNASAVGTWKISPQSGLLLGVQKGEITPVDIDRNGIAEQPRQSTQSVISKLTHRLNKNHQVALRYSLAELDTIGGSMNRLRLSRPPNPLVTSDAFSGQDVRRRFIGDETKITDNVKLSRHEAAASYRGKLENDAVLKIAAGGAWQNFRSIYSHGYDYNNTDQLFAARLEYQQAVTDDHLLSIGTDARHQRMNSESDYLYQSQRYSQDDLRHQNHGFFVQDTWTISERDELSTTLRVDDIKTRWFDLDRSIERTIFAPRLAYKHTHNQVYTSRASYGVGYRSPLTLFESQHGTSHNGFELAVTDPEISQTLGYSLNGQWLDDFFEVSVHGTQLQSMAYAQDRSTNQQPMVFRNSGETHLVTMYDFSYGRRIVPQWTLEGRYEYFDYPWEYKRKLPVAAIEQRISLLSNVDIGDWSASQRATAIGARNLHSYSGYANHYNKAYVDDNFGPTFGEVVASSPKEQRAPWFWTIDLTLDYKINSTFTAGVAVINLFDYTQTGYGDSPTTFHLHSDHYHLDNFHIWGPLRGRQVFANLKGVF